jgi:hypothetical protein
MQRRYSAEQKRLLAKIEARYIKHSTSKEGLDQALKLLELVQRGKVKTVLRVLDKWV